MSRGGALPDPNERAFAFDRTEALPVGTGAARALPFGKDTRNLQINPSAALIQINRWIPNKHCRGPPPSTPPGPSRLLDGDLLLALLCFWPLRQRDREYAVLEMRLDLVGINAVRHAERTLEGAIAAFGEMIVLLLFLPFVLFLTFDGQRAIREFDVDITLVHSRQLDRDFVRLLMLGDVNGWSLAPGDLAAPERLDVEHAASGRRTPRAHSKFVE